MLKIDLITRSYGNSINGLSRYDRNLIEGLKKREDIHVEIQQVQGPRNYINDRLRGVRGLDLATFLEVYPLSLPSVQGDLGHITTNSQAMALRRKPRVPVIVTVHDIIHYTYRHDLHLSAYNHVVDRLASRLAAHNLRYASHIISVSGFTKNELVRHIGIPAESISIIPLGIDGRIFRPLVVPAAFYDKYGLDPRVPYILHVSSEEPRKNIDTLLHAWVHVQKQHPGAMLLKVGRCLHPRERIRLLKLIANLKISESVRFIDEVPEQDLVLFYNAACAFAFPSLSEGFGFPVMEAMACGTPVVCSDAPALTELVAGIGLQHPTTDIVGLSSHLCTLLEGCCHQGREAYAPGLKRASQYSWERTIEETCRVYQRVMEVQGK